MSSLKDLQTHLKTLGKVVVAFSGGVDSTFLLKVAREILGKDNVLAVIGESPTFPDDEVKHAIQLAQDFDVNYQLIKTNEFKDENFVCNSKDRCYYCKTELFSQLKKIATQKDIEHVLDGSNFDDKADYRPGNRAKSELGVRSPLMELSFTKADIRKYSQEMGLPTWDKPSYACLSSRIPYGTRITEENLHQVGEGEKYLKSLGFKQLRVRHHDHIVRIEVEPQAIAELLQLRDEVSKKFESLGYAYITLDLKGYRTGSMNEIL